MIYLLFALSIFLIRMLSGYDSRYQKGKYIIVKNNFWRAVLLDNMSFYGKNNRLKKDKNKMSVWGIPLYFGIATVFIINVVCLIIPDIRIESWSIESNKFIVYGNTLNHKISATAIFILFALVICFFAIASVRIAKEIEQKWIKVLTWFLIAFIIITAVTSLIYFVIDLFFCILNI